MRGLTVGCLVAALGLWAEGRAADGPASAVSLGRPVASGVVVPASYEAPVVRGQIPDPLAPPVPSPVAPPPGPPVGAPAGVPVPPVNPAEQYNCGVVTNPAPSHGFFQSCGDFFGRCKNAVCGETTGARCLFQSDPGFPEMVSPVSNPFLFEDPRALTEVRPIYIQQGTPSNNFIFGGGDIEYAGVQGRLALTERLSLVVSELGAVWMEPHHPVDGFNSHAGFAEVRVGPKYTFYRCEDTRTIAAAGVNFDIPTGSSQVFQNTGSLSVEPYVSAGKTFRTNYGAFNLLDTIGYSVATDNQRTDFLFDSIHLDYDVAGLHKFYPFLEASWFYYTKAGNGPDLGFEGRDLFNFGSQGVSGNNTITLAPGFRYRFNDHLQAGVAYEFPVSGHRDLIDYRVTFDVIFRY